MRGFIRLVGLLIAAVIIAALAIFAVENITLVPVRYVGKSFNGNLWWICVGSAVLGFILAFILLAPGRVVAGWRGRTLGRERLHLQDELAVVHARETQLRADHDQLRAQHDQVSAERDWLRQSGATKTPADAPGSTPATPATPAMAAEDAARTGEPLVPPAQAVGRGNLVGRGDLRAEHVAPERPPTLSQRLRAPFERARWSPRAAPTPSDPSPDEIGYPHEPAAPTS